jgi:hypothetical protein
VIKAIKEIKVSKEI